MPILTNNIAATQDTGGMVVQVDNSSTVDNVNIFAGVSGAKWAQLRDGRVYRASWAILGSGDSTTILQAIVNSSSVTTVLFDAQDYVLNGTLTVPAGKILEFRDAGRITGTGTINGGLIKADYIKQCFGTGISFVGTSTVHEMMSVKWFGTGLSVDSAVINKVINLVISANTIVNRIYLPAATYQLSAPLIAAKFNIGTNKYDFITFSLEGEIPQKSPARDKTRIQCGFTDTFALGVQYGRGITVKNIVFAGNYTLPNSFTDTDLINKAASEWIQAGVSANRYSPYAGIALDPFTAASDFSNPADMYAGLSAYYQGASSSTGTSQVEISECRIDNFYIGIILSPNPRTQENEMIFINECQFGVTFASIASCQAQTKGNVASNIMVWNKTYTVFDSIDFGSQGGGGGGTEFFIDGANIAGNVRQLFRSNAGTYSIHMQKVFAERLWRIGDINGSSVVSIKDCQFDFMNSEAGHPTPRLITDPSGNACIARIYIRDSIVRNYTGDVNALNRLNFVDTPVTLENCSLTGYPLTLSYNINTGQNQIKKATLINCRDLYAGRGYLGEGNSGVQDTNLLLAAQYAESGLSTDLRLINKNISTPLATNVKIEFRKSAEYIFKLPVTCFNYVYNSTTGGATMGSSTTLQKYVKVGDYLFVSNTGLAFMLLGMVTAIDGTTITMAGGQQGLTNISNLTVYVNNVYKTIAPIAATITNGSAVLTNVEQNTTLFSSGAYIGVGDRLDHFAFTGLLVVSADSTAKTLTMAGPATIASGQNISHATICNGTPKATYYSPYPPMFFNSPPFDSIIGGAIWEVTGNMDNYPASRYLITSTTYVGSTLHPFSYNTFSGDIHRCNIAALRTYYGLTGFAYYITDLTKQGTFYYDATDTTTPDDGVNTIVGKGSARFKRVNVGGGGGGGITIPITAKSASFSVDGTMRVVLVDTTSGNITATIDPAVIGTSSATQEVTLVKISSDTNQVQLNVIGSGNLNGNTLVSQFEKTKFVSNGTTLYES